MKADPVDWFAVKLQIATYAALVAALLCNSPVVWAGVIGAGLAFLAACGVAYLFMRMDCADEDES